ncbi:hypothetical protein ACSW9O_15595 (plasmid) [Clostridium perfringens]
MNKIKDITNKELEEWLEVKGKIEMASCESDILLDKKELDKRLYLKNMSVLNSYIDKIKEINFKADKKGIIDIFRSDQKYLDELLEYKSRVQDNLDRIKCCSSCKCISCTIECPFNACIECFPGIKVAICDKENFNITTGYKNIDLDLNDETIHYEVLGMLTDLRQNKKYIYLSEIGNLDNQQILEYEQNIKGEERFDGIEDKSVLEQVYSIFVKNNIFK